ncbi:MAG: hypothetical protein ACLQVJ_29280 [Syntrophobacteraceae bacterium]
MTKEELMEQEFRGKVFKTHSLGEVSLEWVLKRDPDFYVSDADYLEERLGGLVDRLGQLSSLIDGGYIFRINFTGIDAVSEDLSYCVLYLARTGEYLVQSARGVIFGEVEDLFVPDQEKVEAVLATGVKPYTPWKADEIYLKFLSETSSEVPEGRLLGEPDNP